MEDNMDKKGITVNELYDHIIKFLTPEEALKRLLESSLLTYEHLKFEEDKPVHPLIIIANATLDLGWNIAVESKEENVRGLTIGTEEYIDSVLKKESA